MSRDAAGGSQPDEPLRLVRVSLVGRLESPGAGI
jgi:hypothetical protein